MSCNSVQSSLSAHLDGLLPDSERRKLLSHLEGCSACELRLSQLSQLRAALRKLPSRPAPAELTARLRVLASRERARHAAWNQPMAYVAERIWLWMDNLMRPMALPLAGGLLSAMLLFGMLMPTFVLHANPRVADVPVSLFTLPTVKNQTPFGFGDDDFVIEVTVDGQGKMVDYSVAEGSCLTKNAALRRAIENALLFTEFTPATAFGQPITGKMYLSFGRYEINVPSSYTANHS